MKCPHPMIDVKIRVSGWQDYIWTPESGLEHADSLNMNERVPKTGRCSECGKRVKGNFERPSAPGAPK